MIVMKTNVDCTSNAIYFVTNLSLEQWRKGGCADPRDFPPGNFWRLIGKNEAREKGKNMGNVEENEENIKN